MQASMGKDTGFKISVHQF